MRAAAGIRFALVASVALALPPASLAAEPAEPKPGAASPYSFDLSEIEPSPLELNGFAEGKGEYFRLRPDSTLYPFSYGNAPRRDSLARGTASIEVATKYQRDRLTIYGRGNAQASSDALRDASDARLLEGALRFSPTEGLSFDVGKQVQRWGKGYAWNPVGFFERPKDPNDPQLSREGFVMASVDWVRSLPGPLAAVGLTPVALPVTADLNGDYGAQRDTNLGARLYLLYRDTDIDLLWAASGSRPQRLGIDFSRNIGSALEIHGEWARSIGAEQRLIADDGAITTRRANLDSWLIGARYITAREVTWIGELYRNGSGRDRDQIESFHRLAERAFGTEGSAAEQAQARLLAQSGYAGQNPGQRYAYLRASVKDPFDWLYLAPAVTAIVNLDDDSWQLTPELLYTGWQDIEVRLRIGLLFGGRYAEFGEKPARRRIELMLRRYF